MYEIHGIEPKQQTPEIVALYRQMLTEQQRRGGAVSEDDLND